MQLYAYKGSTFTSRASESLETFRTLRQFYGRYPSPKHAAGKHIFYLKNSVKMNKHVKTRRIANTLERAENIGRFSKFQPETSLSSVLYKE